MKYKIGDTVRIRRPKSFSLDEAISQGQWQPLDDLRAIVLQDATDVELANVENVDKLLARHTVSAQMIEDFAV